MDISSLTGLLGVFIIVIVAIITKGSAGAFLDIASILIVLGGTTAAVLTSYPMDKLKNSINVMKKAFKDDSYNVKKTIIQLSQLSYIARKDGLLAMEKMIDDIDDEFMKKGILLIVDGSEPKMIERILNLDLENMVDRHREGEGVLKTFGQYSPAFGMIGTLIGLILMLKNLDDVASLGPSMGVALITTFYGTLLANGVFLPLAGKLRYKSDQEVRYRNMVIEGILSVQAGETPLMIEEKLKTFMEQGKREEDLEEPEEEIEEEDDLDGVQQEKV
jgi:chemotaxis protein MotA